MTIKATSSQWYWTYDYPDHGDINFDQILKEKADLKDGEPYLLATDNAMVVPVNKIVRMIVTSNDVIHAWTIPSFGSKIDAIPGRLNETWFKGHHRGRLLRTVLRAVRQGSRLYADRGSRRVGSSV